MPSLDLGYTITSVDGLVNRYITDFFPASANTSKMVKAANGTERFRWTSHPWLIDAILNNQTGLTTEAVIAELSEAIKRGDVVWHANPHNVQSEAAEIGHLSSGFDIARRLNERFNISEDEAAERMSGASQKDEPGITLGMVGMMARSGVKMLHVGVNDFSTVVAAPASSAHYHGKLYY